MIVRAWIVALVVIASLVAVAGFAYRQSGLPIACYKDSQRITKSPGGANKLVAYEWRCQKELFGINFGPFGRPAIGFEIVPTNISVARRGFPPPIMLCYREPSRVEKDELIPPRFRISWKDAVDIHVTHQPDSKPCGIPRIRSYHFTFRVERKLPTLEKGGRN